MYYIIDGPDGAGKSTLARQIQEANPGSIILHFGTPATEEEANNYWLTYFNALKDYADKVVIFDRSWYSDMVYGPVMRNRCEMSPEHAEMLEMTVRSLGGGIVIYCTGVQSKLWSRCVRRGETYIPDSAVHKRICEAYDSVMRDITWLPVIRYNTTTTW